MEDLENKTAETTAQVEDSAVVDAAPTEGDTAADGGSTTESDAPASEVSKAAKAAKRSAAKAKRSEAKAKAKASASSSEGSTIIEQVGRRAIAEHKLESVFVTSDGVAFHLECDAKGHAANLADKTVTTINK